MALARRQTIVIGALVPLLAIGAVAYATHRLAEQRRTETVAEAWRRAHQVAASAKDALDNQSEAVQFVAHNAASNPRLAAALDARVDARTLSDLFSSEQWLSPYRTEYAVAVFYEGGQPVFTHGRVTDLPLGDLVRRAREQPRPLAELWSHQGKPLFVAASSVRSGRRPTPAVLVFARALDGAWLDVWAERAGGAVLLSDGRSVIAEVGPQAELAQLRKAIGKEWSGSFGTGDETWIARAQGLSTGLWLWASGNAKPFARVRAAADAQRNVLLWGAAGLVAVGSALLTALSLRGSRGADRLGVPAEAKAPADEVDASQLVTQNGTTGVKLGRYVLLDRIGEGGMAEIFTAVSFGKGGFRRTFVIKRLRPEMANNPMAVNQFIDEANLGSKLVHPNVVPIFDFGEVGGDYFLAQEYVVGRDLGRVTRRLINRDQPALSPRAVLFIAHEILAALEYAHDLRDEDGTPLELVHRDVSPENIMISERGEVKLLDFGIVKATQGRTTRTDIGLVKGNVDFMAPEQARGRPVDARADLFSVGLVMYFALAQEPLYEGETTYDSLVKAAHGPGTTEQERIALLPAPLPQILARALAFSVDDRYQTAAEFRNAIAPFTEGGREELVEVMRRLFDDELRAEQERLSAAYPRTRTREAPVPTAS